MPKSSMLSSSALDLRARLKQPHGFKQIGQQNAIDQKTWSIPDDHGKLADPLHECHRGITATSEVSSARTTSTSFIRWTGLKK